MLANFVRQLCDGQGDSLGLKTAIQGGRTFASAFQDGDVVKYSLRNALGTVWITGNGIYDGTNNVITRNDNWNYNGVTEDHNPATNISLGAGDHEIWCAVSYQDIGGLDRIKAGSNTNLPLLPDNVLNTSSGSVLTANFGYFMPAKLDSAVEFSKLWYHVKTADAAATGEIGLFTADETGRPVKAIATAAVDITTAARKNVSVGGTIIAPPGRHCIGVVTSSSTVTFERFNYCSNGAPGYYVFRGAPAVVRLDLGQATFPTDLSTQSRFDTDPANSAAVGFNT